jgi:hypothetical protein
MHAWSEIAAAIGAELKIARQSEGWLELLWEFPVDGGAPIEQRVEVTVVAGAGRRWLRVLAIVASRRAVDPTIALERNFSLQMGALAISGEWLLLSRSLLLPLASHDELRLALEHLPHEAARMRVGLDEHLTAVPALGEYAD